jgi:hypothetical protein
MDLIDVRKAAAGYNAVHSASCNKNAVAGTPAGCRVARFDSCTTKSILNTVTSSLMKRRLQQLPTSGIGWVLDGLDIAENNLWPLANNVRFQNPWQGIAVEAVEMREVLPDCEISETKCEG